MVKTRANNRSGSISLSGENTPASNSRTQRFADERASFEINEAATSGSRASAIWFNVNAPAVSTRDCWLFRPTHGHWVSRTQ